MTNPADRPGPEAPARGLEQLKREGRGQHPVVVRNVDDALRLGEIFVRSGFFADAKAVSQAVVKILYGVELGLGPMAAMTGIEIVEGRVTPGANLTASMLEESPDYDYRVDERSSERCTITFLRRDRETGEWRERGSITWTIDDAKRARLYRDDLNPKAAWKAYPRAMLYARAMTEGARTYCPNLFSGITAYSAEELGVELDEQTAAAEEAAVAGAEAIARQEAEAERAAAAQPAGGSGEPPATPPAPAATAGEPEDDDGTAEEGAIVEPPDTPDAGGDAQEPQEAPEAGEAHDPAEATEGPEAPAEGAEGANPGDGDDVPFPTTEEAEARRAAAVAPAEEPPPAPDRSPTPAQGSAILAQTRLAGLLSLGVPGPRVRELRAALGASDDLDLCNDDVYHTLADLIRAEAAAGAAGGSAS